MMETGQRIKDVGRRLGQRIWRRDDFTPDGQSPNGAPEPNGAPDMNGETGVRETSEVPPQFSTNGSPDDALGRARGPREDWDKLPPTDQQRRYIRVLGGDPAEARTKAEADELIKRLRRLRGPSPLDPYSLEERGAKAGREAESDWRSAHYGLLAGLRLDLQQYIDSTLDSLRARLSDSGGPAGTSSAFGPQNLVQKAKMHLERLRVWRRHGEPVGVPIPDVSPRAVDRANEDDSSDHPPAVASAPSPPDGPHDTPAESNLPGLIAVLSVLVTIEAMVNVPLLRSVLPGGPLEAFTLAILVSFINVGGFGIGAGVLLSWLRWQPNVAVLSLRAASVAWVVIAISFNVIAGRHREAYAQIANAADRQQPGETLPAVQELLPGISWNPLTWEFQALLFAVLGMVLCAAGFAKGFTFIKKAAGYEHRTSAADGLEVRTPPSDHGRGPSEPMAHIVSAYNDARIQFSANFDRLRTDTAAWYSTLDQQRRDVQDAVNMLAEPENRQACIDCVTHAFIREYNNGHADKIDLETVVSHRREQHPEPILVAPSDGAVLGEAEAVATEWKASGQSELDRQIVAAQEEVTALWARYEPLVLGPAGAEE